MAEYERPANEFYGGIDSDDDSVPPPPPQVGDNGISPSNKWRVLKREAEHALVAQDDDVPYPESNVPLQGHFRGIQNAQDFDEEEAGMDEIEVPSSSVVTRMNDHQIKSERRKKMMKLGIVGLLALGAVAGVAGGLSSRNSDIAAIEQTGGNQTFAGPVGNSTDVDTTPEDVADIDSVAGQYIANNFDPKTANSLADNTSFAAKALDWVLHHPDNVNFDFTTLDTEEAKMDFRQRFGAAALHYSFSDANTEEDAWLDAENWMSSEDVCNWSGISCGDYAGRRLQTSVATNAISKIDLQNNNIAGPIPIELTLLVDVDTLILNGNWLTGAIPDEIYSMTNLVDIDFTDNVLSGPISPLIAGLTNLKVLYLGKNELTGAIPAELGQLQELDTVWLSDNWIGGAIPPELANASNLIDLDFSLNLLTGAIPEGLGNLENLSYLTLDNNQLTGGVPETFGTDATPPLKEFTVSQNYGLFEFSWNKEFPQSLLNLASLEVLSMANTKMTGELPLMENFPNMKKINLSENDLTGYLPLQWAEMTTLVDLDVRNNALVGQLPWSYMDLQNLKMLDISGNKFGTEMEGDMSARVPAEYGNMASLEVLNLAGNWLTGELPPQLGQLSNLVVLDASDNLFSSAIPEFIADLGNLNVLRLQNNYFEDANDPDVQKSDGFIGDIPGFLSGLANLVDIRLDGNSLSGFIPDDFCARDFNLLIAVCGDTICEGDACCNC